MIPLVCPKCDSRLTVRDTAAPRFAHRATVLAGWVAAVALLFVDVVPVIGADYRPVPLPTTSSTLPAYPSAPSTSSYTPPANTQTARQRFLQSEISRLRSAIATDRELVNRQAVAAPAFRIGGQVLSAMLNNSKNANDRRAAPYVSPVLSGGGDALGSEVERARAAAEARISSNQTLLNQYQTELYNLSR
ncbi:MAG: hypothetical protein U0736_15975 [Gemmataceae bacterium]